MFVLGMIVAFFVVFFARKRPDICFLLGLPSLLFIGQLKELIPLSVSGISAFFPWAAFAGKIIRGHKFVIRRCELLLICLALWMVYSVSYSSNPAYGREKCILFCLMVIPTIIFAPYVITNIRSLRKIVSLITVSLFTYVLFSALLFVTFGSIDGRMAFLDDVIRAGQFLGVSSSIFLVHIFFSNHRLVRKVFYGLIMSISLVLLLVTGTRAALLGYILTILFIYWFVYADWLQRISKKAGTFYVIISILIIGILIVKISLPPHMFERFSSVQAIFSNFSSDNLNNWQDSNSRALNYGSAVEGFFANPLMGVGAGGYESVLSKYRPVRPIMSPDVVVHTYPHNIILEFAVEQGVIGLALILYILFLNFKNIFFLRSYVHKNESDRFLISFCVCIYIYGLVVSMTSLDIPRMMILWWGMGLLLTTDKIFRQAMVTSKFRIRKMYNNSSLSRRSKWLYRR